MFGNDLYDPGLHLFLDDDDVQDHPGFLRKVQHPQRLQDPVLEPDRPWEGESAEVWGSVLYDDEEGIFKMWYRVFDGTPRCYATSKDGVSWDKPDLGVVSFDGSTANNIVYPPPGDVHDLSIWGVIKDPLEQDESRRYKLAGYRQLPAPPDVPEETPDMDREARNARRKILFDRIRDRHGMCAAYSPDGIHWTADDTVLVPRAGDNGSLVYDPMARRYLATSRRYETVMDHFVIEWKRYRRVIALSTSDDFVNWSPIKPILKPDDFDHPEDQLYVMPPFVYGNQYIGFIGMQHSTELGPVQLATARDINHWSRVGRREEFLPVGAPGTWDGGWSTMSHSPPVLKDGTLYMWYTGSRQAHGTHDRFVSAIGMATLRKDGFVALRCGIRGGDLMTEPVEVTGPRLSVNAICLFGRVQIRVIDDVSVPEGYDFADCNALERRDDTDCPITWGEGKRDLSPFVGKKVRLHIQADNATSLFSYRMGS